jgi:hypothetical protein
MTIDGWRVLVLDAVARAARGDDELLRLLSALLAEQDRSKQRRVEGQAGEPRGDRTMSTKNTAHDSLAIVNRIDRKLVTNLTIALAALKDIAASGSDYTSGDGHAYAVRLAKDAIAKLGEKL